mgnify:CR=1 FL=1
MPPELLELCYAGESETDDDSEPLLWFEGFEELSMIDEEDG